jgi:hypothetical protein
MINAFHITLVLFVYMIYRIRNSASPSQPQPQQAATATTAASDQLLTLQERTKRLLSAAKKKNYEQFENELTSSTIVMQSERSDRSMSGERNNDSDDTKRSRTQTIVTTTMLAPLKLTKTSELALTHNRSAEKPRETATSSGIYDYDEDDGYLEDYFEELNNNEYTEDNYIEALHEPGDCKSENDAESEIAKEEANGEARCYVNRLHFFYLSQISQLNAPANNLDGFEWDLI